MTFRTSLQGRHCHDSYLTDEGTKVLSGDTIFILTRLRGSESLIQGQTSEPELKPKSSDLYSCNYFYHRKVKKKIQSGYLLTSVSTSSPHGVTLSIQGYTDEAHCVPLGVNNSGYRPRKWGLLSSTTVLGPNPNSNVFPVKPSESCFPYSSLSFLIWNLRIITLLPSSCHYKN